MEMIERIKKQFGKKCYARGETQYINQRGEISI